MCADRKGSTVADIERLNVALPTPMADSVRKAVADGEYAYLRRRWDEGKASGRAGPLDVKRILAEERAAFKGPHRWRGGTFHFQSRRSGFARHRRYVAADNPTAADRVLLGIDDSRCCDSFRAFAPCATTFKGVERLVLKNEPLKPVTPTPCE